MCNLSVFCCSWRNTIYNINLEEHLCDVCACACACSHTNLFHRCVVRYCKTIIVIIRFDRLNAHVIFTYIMLTNIWISKFTLVGLLFRPVCCHVLIFCVFPPKGRLGMSDVSPLSGISRLSFDSTLLSTLLIFCGILLLCLIFSLPAGPFSWTFSRNFFDIFHLEIGFSVWLLFSS